MSSSPILYACVNALTLEVVIGFEKIARVVASGYIFQHLPTRECHLQRCRFWILV